MRIGIEKSSSQYICSRSAIRLSDSVSVQDRVSWNNEALFNELWKTIKSMSAGLISQDHGLAGPEGLICAEDFSEDIGKGIYCVKGIGDGHCVYSRVLHS